jgi:type I protein arginine methyltransferase
VYSLREFGDMIADTRRFNAYSQAIAQSVNHGDVVLEIGCGPGVFALLACRAGARKVYAVDCEEIVHFARELAAASGFTDRIDFICSDSRRLDLTERANVIISDIRGALPLFSHAVTAIEDARQRLLAANGVLIPQRDILQAAVVELEGYYSRLTSPWLKTVSGIDLSRALLPIVNGVHSVEIKREQLLTDNQIWGVLDYQSGAVPDMAGTLSFRVGRPGTGHGICLWFEAQLFETICFSSGPGGAMIYGQLFLPWPEGIALHDDTRIVVQLCANLVGNDYVWRWETRISQADGTQRHFRQSTFQGSQFSSASLRRGAADFVPTLSEQGEADRWLLQAMDGKASLQQIAEAAAKRYPKLFPRWQDALTRAGELSVRLSR